MNPLLYRNTSNDRSPESQQVHSLDKVFVFVLLLLFFVCLFVCLFVCVCFFCFVFFVFFFLPYMGITAILVMFQVYGCNSFHRIVGPVNTYLRPSCHFFPCKRICSQK